MARMREEAREQGRQRQLVESPNTQPRQRRRVDALVALTTQHRVPMASNSPLLEVQLSQVESCPVLPLCSTVVQEMSPLQEGENRVVELGGLLPRVNEEESFQLGLRGSRQSGAGQGRQNQRRNCQASRGSRFAAPPQNRSEAGEPLFQGEATLDDGLENASRGRGGRGERGRGRRGKGGDGAEGGRGSGRGKGGDGARGGRGGGQGRGGDSVRGRRGGGRGSRGGRKGATLGTRTNSTAPDSWVRPEILSDRQSPIRLRRLVARGLRPNFDVGEVEDLTRVNNDVQENINGFVTPPRSMGARRNENSSACDGATIRTTRPPSPAVCRYSLQDFTPGAPPVSTDQRQSIGEYRANRHDCGEKTCPFGQFSMTMHRNALMAGYSIEAGLTAGDHVKVDGRAFPREQYVKVPLAVLGYDPGLWGDLQHFSGLVVQRYYHEVHGQPMFSVEFGGSIGIREVLVTETHLDAARGNGVSVRALDFGVNALQTPLVESIQRGQSSVTAPLVNEAESDSDSEWEATWEDFPEISSSGKSSSPSGSYCEQPMCELGIYDEDEDTSGWDFAKTWANDQWNETNLFLQGPRTFTGPEPGPTTFRAIPGNPLDYFRSFWPTATLSRIIQETNRYAEQDDHDNVHLSNGRANWVDIDEPELLSWFGILILMGLKELPHRRMYWDGRPFYGCPIISSAMSRQRFEAIVRCIHLVDNQSLTKDPQDPGFDRIGKIRWLIEGFAQISQSLYNLERVCTVDEIMVPYKGRYCAIRQYMKSKPVRFGVKLWALASSTSRYVSNCIVYLGSSSERPEGELVGEDAVLQAVRGYEHRGHTIVTDNFFTGVKLHMSLLAKGFFATGTAKKTSRGFPSSLAGFPQTQLPPRGTVVVRVHRSRKIAAVCWVDSKPVFLLSTATDPCDPTCVAPRWIPGRRDRVEFPTSPILLEYQQFMRGIDVVDQQRGEYTVQLQSHKWWHRLLMFVLDSSCLNAYILYRADAERVGMPVASRLLWHYELAMALVGPALAGGHIRGRHRNLAPAGFHRSEGHPSARRACVVCRKVTRRFCGGCAGRFMCEGMCYVHVHTQPGFVAAARR